LTHSQNLSVRIFDNGGADDVKYGPSVLELLPSIGLTVISGPAASGKTTALLRVAAAVSRNCDAQVLWLNHDDRFLQDIVPRLREFDAVLQNVLHVAGNEIDVVAELPRLAYLLRRFPRVELLAIDPVTSFLWPDWQRPRDWVPLLRGFALRRQIAIVATRHSTRPSKEVTS
jgi:hypothetical protein